jgi:hypothetical protein
MTSNECQWGEVPERTRIMTPSDRSGLDESLDHEALRNGATSVEGLVGRRTGSAAATYCPLT